MNCLLCTRELQRIPTFYELFLLRQPIQTLCSHCQKKFEKIPDKHCPRCCKPNNGVVCQDCHNWELQGIYVNHFSIFQYNDAMKEFFSNYKFSGDYRLRKVFAPYFKFQNSTYTFVPIPLSIERFQSRGFNQVTAFLDAVSIPYKNLLLKSDTIQQSRLTRIERLAIKNAFSIKENAQIPNKIMLIDDIYTTGTTLQQAIQTLKIAGAKDIKTFSLCR